MKIALLSGAYKNAGDFLIVERTCQLLEHVITGCEIMKFERRLPLDAELEKVNGCDAVVVAGGPMYHRAVYPKVFPLVNDLSKILPPFLIIGGGCNVRSSASTDIFSFSFSESARKLLDRVEKDGMNLGCRDVITAKILNHQNYKSSVVTGCPAWYDVEYIGKSGFCNNKQQIKRIAISDPGKPENYANTLKLLKWLRMRYPEAELLFIFHRGISADANTSDKKGALLQDLVGELDVMGVKYKDIAYGAEGFGEYNECDLHVGYRVHAHIYNLSQARRSILIEEDSRGAGVNQVLGLPSIPAYSYTSFPKNRYIRKLNSMLSDNVNPYVVEEVEGWLSNLDTYDQMIINAFTMIQKYYDVMHDHIKQLSRLS